jgi:hypothetical protein
MKKFLILSFAALLITIAGCNNDSPTGTGGFGDGGNDGTGGVTFTIGQRNGTQGIIFTAKPSTAVTVTSVTVRLPAQNFQDDLQADGQTVFQPDQFYDIDEYTGVASGQQWTFRFQGRIGNAQGTQYDVTSNYTVP